MGVREFANKHPNTISITVAVVGLICVVAITIEIFANRRTYSIKAPDCYFTVDDGQSWFVDSTEKYPPFDHDGQQAVRVYVFQCNSGKKFAGYLERYVTAAKKDLDAGKPLSNAMLRFGREVKRPGESKWTKTGDIAAETKVENITCPDGGSIVEIEPGD